jgi:hypothetical protein
MRLKWKLGLVNLEIVLLLMQNWCTVCVVRTVGSEIVLEAPDVIHPAQVGLAEAQLIKVARTPTVLMHTHSEKDPMSLKD